MKQFALIMTILFAAVFAEAAVNWGKGSKCQILDRSPSPVYEISGAYVEEADIEAGTDTGLFEIDASWGCAYFYDTLGGDVDMSLDFGSVFFLQTASLDLPEHVTQLSLDIEWVNRLHNGWNLVIGLRPGIYSDLETLDGDGFFIPLRFAGVKTFSSEFSGIAGLEYRQGFDRELFPLVGLAWQPDKAFRLELGVPQSIVRWNPDDIWSVYGKFTWENVTYSLRERDNDNRETLTLEDYRNIFGISRMMDDRISLAFEVGKVYHRTLAFERRNASTVELDIDKSIFLRCGVGGYF